MNKVLFVFFCMLLAVPGMANAQSSEQITKFQSDIKLGSNNVAEITEEITYDFGENQRRGIFRYVPTTTIAGDSGKYYYYNVAWGDVKQDGKPAEILVEQDGDFSALRIGNPNIYLSGEHVYTISYTLNPVAQRDDQGDYVSLNITGNEWNVPIEQVKASLTFTSGADILSTKCFTGSYGETANNCKVSSGNNNKVVTTASKLVALEGLTLDVLTNKGAFSVYQVAQDPPPLDWAPFAILLIGLLGLLIGLILRLKSWMQYRWRRKDQTIIPIYEAPKDLSPGSIGLLYDNKSDMKEITATLIDLAVRGHLKIEQTQEKSLFKNAKYTFHKLESKDKLKPHEQELYDLLFPASGKSKRLEDVDKTKAAEAIKSIKKTLIKILEDHNYTYKAKHTANRQTANKIFGLMITVVFFWGLGLTLDRLIREGMVVHVIILTVISLGMLIVGWALTSRTELSPSGYKKWAEIEGLKMYLSVAEKDRLEFHNAPERNPEHFSALLPYAVALGVEKQWAKQFEGLNMTDNPDWYSGAGRFTPIILANSLSSDFSGAIASGFTPASQSSGFGGGFSGGGAGGGGGGSW